MIGPEGAAARAAAWLGLRLPVRLAMIRHRNGDLARAVLPDPAVVLDYDKLSLGIEEWPAVAVVPQGLGQLVPLDVDPAAGTELYRGRYTIRVYVYVRGDGEREVNQLRNRYVLAVREALLERKSLTMLPAYGEPRADDSITVDPSTLRESYSDLTTTAEGTIAAAWLGIDVLVAEELPAVTADTAPAAMLPDGEPAAGPGMTEHTADTITVDEAVDADTRRVPTHPAYL